jgi:enediyne biosynthesis protein E3
MLPFGDTSEGIDRGFLQGDDAALEEDRPDRLGSMSSLCEKRTDVSVGAPIPIGSGDDVRSVLSRLRKRLFGISSDEASFSRRGFRGSDKAACEYLEGIGRGFLQGYHAALEEDRPDRLGSMLDGIESELRGFAFEGAGMGLYLLDLLTPWRRDRLVRFLAGAGEPHAYMLHVGAGWALAQLGRRADHAMQQFDPLLGWLAIDGYGFHEGYFHWPESVDRLRVPERFSGYARRVFDQGLGRSLWFVEGAEIARINETIAGFPRSRRADLWSGIGLACAYAGGVPAEAIHSLIANVGTDYPHLAQGVAFAAKARERAGNRSTDTDMACLIVCGMPAEVAAGMTDLALIDLPPDGTVPAYEVWRLRIQANWVKESVAS